MPLVVCVPGLLFALAQLFIAVRTGAKAQAVATRAEAKAFAWIADFIGAILLVGFTAGAPLAVAAYPRFAARESWKVAAAGGVVCFAMIYGLFDRLLSAHLFEGIIALW